MFCFCYSVCSWSYTSVHRFVCHVCWLMCETVIYFSPITAVRAMDDSTWGGPAYLLMDRREAASSNFASLHTDLGQKIIYQQLFYCKDKKEDISECLWFPVVDEFISGQQQQQQSINWFKVLAVQGNNTRNHHMTWKSSRTCYFTEQHIWVLKHPLLLFGSSFKKIVILSTVLSVQSIKQAIFICMALYRLSSRKCFTGG